MPVADVYAAWATNSPQDLPLGSLLFYSGIGLYPRTLETYNLASWQPDLERLGDQINWTDTIYAYRHSDAARGTPAKYKPTISPTRMLHLLRCSSYQTWQSYKPGWQEDRRLHQCH